MPGAHQAHLGREMKVQVAFFMLRHAICGAGCLPKLILLIKHWFSTKGSFSQKKALQFEDPILIAKRKLLMKFR